MLNNFQYPLEFLDFYFQNGTRLHNMLEIITSGVLFFFMFTKLRDQPHLTILIDACFVLVFEVGTKNNFL